MPASSRTIQNTPKILEKIKQCSKLAENLGNENKKKLDEEIDQEFVSLEFLKFLKSFWNQHSNENKIYLNELLEGNELLLPKVEPPIPNPEFRARTEKLKMQLDEKEYQRIVANVDLNSQYRSEQTDKTSIVPEFKTLKGQLVAIINIVATIGGAFMFGYKAVEYSLEEPDIIKQMMAGLFLGIIVAIADFYFLFKKLIEIDDKKSI